MKITVFAAGLLACSTIAAVPALAQDPTAMTGSLSSSDVGVAPVAGLSASDYVNAAADSDLYEITSAASR